MHKPIYSITPFSLLDFPGKTACILWFTGCNMRCPYCYNPEIVLGRGHKTMVQALDFLTARKGLLEAVVFSGGECTLHRGIVDLADEAKQMGYAIKIDTNGTRPQVLRALLDRHLIDYLALDFKALPEKYDLLTGSSLFKQFEESLLMLMEAKQDFEVRTTVHNDLLSMEDVQQMATYLEQKKYQGVYYLQNFLNNVNTLSALPRSSRLQGVEQQIPDSMVNFLIKVRS